VFVSFARNKSCFLIGDDPAMKTVVFLLSLVFLVPALSYPFNDCDNCRDCRNNKCHKCNEGYALTKIYVRRLCVRASECWGGEKTGVVWDPVLGTHICDQRGECGASSKCVEYLVSGSCTKCKQNFALRLWSKGHIGYNVCDKNCEKCVEPKSQAQVCKSSAALCAPPATHPPNPDCNNCQDCRNNKCHKCDDGYALTKIYVRRLCVRVSECWGGEKNGVVWDPVLGTHICDQRGECEASSKCVDCLISGSCTKCKENFALRLWSKDHIGYNVCDENCETCVEPKNQAQICKSSAALCASPVTHPPTPAVTTAAVVTNPVNAAEGSIKTTPDMDPSTVGTDE